MGGKAFDGEGTGDADFFLVLIGLVVEILEIGLGGDGGIYGLLAGDAGLPEPGEGRMGAGGPVGRGIAGDFPVEQGAGADGFAAGQGDVAAFRRVEMQELALPSAAGDFVGCFMALQGCVQGGQGVADGGLPPVPDDVDLGVVGDGLEGDVGHPLTDEAVADAAVSGLAGGEATGNFRLFLLTFRAVGEEIVGITGAHDAGAGQCQGDAGGVEGDPAAAPLFGDIGGGAGAASGVED